MVFQQNSPKSIKKIKEDRDPQTPRERTRSKTRHKTAQVLNKGMTNRPYIQTMLYTYKIATININGIALTTKLQMIADFLQKHDIDIALLQEITHDNFDTVHGHIAMVNEGMDKKQHC